MSNGLVSFISIVVMIVLSIIFWKFILFIVLAFIVFLVIAGFIARRKLVGFVQTNTPPTPPYHKEPMSSDVIDADFSVKEEETARD